MKLPNDNIEESSVSEDDFWIIRFMSHRKNRYLDRIQDSFVQDRFNFHGFKEKIEEFEKAYLAIRDKIPSRDFATESLVYLLAHQRYIYTKTGLDNILDKVLNKEYGICNKLGCKDIPYIPTGLVNEPGKLGTRVYCFNCEGIYEPHGTLKHLDGCAWGIGFAHYLILNYPYHFERRERVEYVPRVFGFQLAEMEDNDSG